MMGVLKKEFPHLSFVHAGEALLNEPIIRELLNKSDPAAEGHSLELVFTDNPDVPGRLDRFLKQLKSVTSGKAGGLKRREPLKAV